MGKMKKKGESGEGSLYLSRNQAIRKLQLSLKDFRRLCILKGIYPREPHNRRKAQRGSSERKTLYFRKDIQFLMHEPIIWKLRDTKVFYRKLSKAIGRKDKEARNRLSDKKPTYKLDHIVKERYPTFIDALRDLEDPLCLIFLLCTFPKSVHKDDGLVKLCKKLSIEFMHYVIHAKALRKVFISIKGYYFQVEILGQLITWVVPHQLPFWHPVGVDFNIMYTFSEFYVTLLGFVNFRLYHLINLHYPPKLTDLTETKLTFESKFSDFNEDKYLEGIEALNNNIAKIGNEDELEIDDFSQVEDADSVQAAREVAEGIKRLEKLFEGLKIFISREVPRESLVFVIRCVEGQVSWDSTVFEGASFSEDDETITHQVIDRPTIPNKYLSRYYVQPQWVFDCINARLLLPVEDYFPGVKLPPHLSPFVEEEDGEYIPPEKQALLIRQKGLEAEDEVFGEFEEVEAKDDQEDKTKKASRDSQFENKEMCVKPGAYKKPDHQKEAKLQTDEEHKLSELMIRKKYKRLYKMMTYSKKRKENEAKLLTKKRKEIEKSKTKSR